MPTSHDLKGLMKFLAREEWRECFDEVFYDHFGPVLMPATWTSRTFPKSLVTTGP
ncbi:hypothetical protein ACOJBM_06745 [Rhizobium beringeri]